MSAIKQFLAKGIERLNYEGDLQGFTVDVPLGDEEPKEATQQQPENDDDAEEKLNELIAQTNEDKAKKQREASEWRRKGDAFVNGASKLWIFAQSQMGHGTAHPNWGGDRKLLSPGASRERQELVKIFQQYGGKTAALAWYVFAGGVPDLDENTGRPKFTLVAPHRQFASQDKRPSQFAKYFNAILQDKFFKDFATKTWEATEPALRSYFPDTIDQEPRDLMDGQVRAGVEFGQRQDAFSEAIG